MHGLPDATGQGEPEADVHMPHRGRPHRLGHREEERLVPGRRVKLRGNAEFFGGLAPDGAERMLARLDMPSGRQPQAGQPVIAQQDAPGRPVDEQEIRHQMRRRGERLDPPEDVIGPGQPRQRVPAVFPSEVIRRLDAGHKTGDHRLHGCRHTRYPAADR